MYKLPMFGCSDPSQVLTEIKNCTESFPDAYIRLVAFDQVRSAPVILPSDSHVIASRCCTALVCGLQRCTAAIHLLQLPASVRQCAAWLHSVAAVEAGLLKYRSLLFAGPPGAVRWLPGAPPAGRHRVHPPGEALHLSC